MKHVLLITIFIGGLLTLSIARADDVPVKPANPANPANTSVAVAVSQGSARNALEDKFRMALIEEETGQQLDTAIQAYKEVIAGLDDQRKMAVTAIFHLGECYRKQGKTNEALAQFERILRDFSEQKVVVDLAQRRCAELSPGKNGKVAGQGFGLAISTDAMTPEEADEIQKIKAIIKDSPDLINAKDQQGLTPLLKAAISGHLTVVKYLLANSADLSARDALGRTALHIASQHGHKSVVEYLLSQGVDVNSRDGGQATPLLLAVEIGFKSIVQVLLDNKADVNAVGFDNPNVMRNSGSTPFNTPLHYAIMQRNLDMVKLLLANKADPNGTNSSGLSPIFSAILETGNHNDQALKIIEKLIECKANVNIYVKGGRMDEIDGTPLHLAMVFYNKRVVEMLISQGADVNATNRSGNTPLHVAVSNSGDLDEGEKVKVKNAIELLLNHGAGINVQNNDGDTPLHFAVRMNNTSTADFLLKHKADFNIANRAGKTPLMLSKEVSFPQRIPIPNGPQQKVTELEKLLRKYGATDTLKKAE